jgi:leukotriene-A4 hydrolase
MLPCQDTPSRKSTYSAKVSVKDRKYKVLMSALMTKSTANTFWWNQAVPIPIYLIALAVGEFYQQDISPISRVYAMS